MGLGIGGIVSVGGTGGGGGGSSSGIFTLNPGSNTGPTVDVQGVNGIEVTSPSTNVILIDGVSLSGTVTKFSQTFVGITSGLFNHNLGTEDVIVQVHDANVPRRVIYPDEIKIENSNQVSLLFNVPQDGKVVIV